MEALPSSSFYERKVIDVFRRMSAGHLSLHLPDGHTVSIGSPASQIHAVIHVRDPEFFKSVMLYGDIGFGEAYTAGWWDTPSIERVISWAILNVKNTPGMSGSRLGRGLVNLLARVNRIQHWARPNSKKMARRNISEHYDLGNDFYSLWLDETMTYSSGLYTRNDMPLKAAQTAKYDALCRRLELKAGDRVLEIGCGWGGFASHAAKNYGCHITALTISAAQYEYASERFLREGIADSVDLRMEDYRDTAGQFDKIVSIEMMEALGDRYLETFTRQLHRLLKPEGLVALQFITCPDQRHDEMRRNVDWIQKHIFPGSLLLSLSRVGQAMRRSGDLMLHELQDMGLHYARTLREWWATFNDRRSEILALGFDDRFMRKWNYYLQYCEAAFASRNISVVQAVYTRPNNTGIQRSPL